MAIARSLEFRGYAIFEDMREVVLNIKKMLQLHFSL